MAWIVTIPGQDPVSCAAPSAATRAGLRNDLRRAIGDCLLPRPSPQHRERNRPYRWCNSPPAGSTPSKQPAEPSGSRRVAHSIAGNDRQSRAASSPVGRDFFDGLDGDERSVVRVGRAVSAAGRMAAEAHHVRSGRCMAEPTRICGMAGTSRGLIKSPLPPRVARSSTGHAA
jgi:hypothetical protein